MLAHVVVDFNVVAFENQITIQLHLLTGNTRALGHSVLNLLSVSQREFLHSLKVFALVGDGCVKDGLRQCNEVSTISHEVGLTLQGNHSSKTFNALNEYTTIGGLTVATLGSDGQTALAEQFLGLVEVALCLGQCLFHVGQTSTGHSAELLDIINRNCHFVFYSLII